MPDISGPERVEDIKEQVVNFYTIIFNIPSQYSREEILYKRIVTD